MISAQFDSFGKPEDVVAIIESEPLPLNSDEVRLRLLASPINPADINLIQGTYGYRPDLPATPGMEGCAEVIESRSPQFNKGARVIFLRRGGVWCSEMIAPADKLIPVPADIDPIQASMLGVNPLTAQLMLDLFVDLKPGDVVIQNAANSNVGRCLIQLAAQRGIKTINCVRRPELIPELEALGADHVLLDESSLRKSVPTLGLPAPKLAINCVGGDSALLQLKLLAEEGAQVTYGAMARQPYQIPNGLLIFKRVSLHGFWVTKWLEKQSRQTIIDAYQKLAHSVIAGHLQQAIDTQYPLTEISSALAHAQQHHRAGKILLQP